MAQTAWQHGRGGLAIAALAAVALAGCGGGGSKVSGPSGTSGTSTTVAAQGRRVKGTITKAPGVTMAALDAVPSHGRTWLAAIGAQFVAVAEAALGDPVANAKVTLTCGSQTQTTFTSPEGEFEFDNVSPGSCSLSVQVGSVTFPNVATFVVSQNTQTFQVEGTITQGATPSATPGVSELEIDANTDEIDDDGSEHRGQQHAAGVRVGGPGSPKGGPSLPPSGPSVGKTKIGGDDQGQDD